MYELESETAGLLFKALASDIPDLEGLIAEMKKSFCLNRAKKEGIYFFLFLGLVFLNEGFDSEFDQSIKTVEKCRELILSYWAGWKDVLGYQSYQSFRLKKLVLKDIGREPFQLELPKDLKVPDEFMLMSATKSSKRYWTLKMRDYIKEYEIANDKVQSISRSAFLRIQSLFARKYKLQVNTLSISLSRIDCIVSLTKFSLKIKGLNLAQS